MLEEVSAEPLGGSWPLPLVTAERCQGCRGEASFWSTEILRLRAQNDTLFVALHVGWQGDTSSETGSKAIGRAET